MLVEHADSAELWAQAEILRDAGYRVATCRGPTGEDGWPKGGAGETLQCPLIESGRCSLVEAADVVLSGDCVGQNEALLAAQAAAGKPVVFEAPAPMFERYADISRGVRMLALPVTEKALLSAVGEAAWTSD